MYMDPLLPPLVGVLFSILLLGLLLKSLRQPELIGYLIAGVIIGPYGFHWISDQSMVEHLGSLGVTLLLFFIGMEISPSRLIAGWRIAVLGTLLQILISIIVVWIIGQYFHWGFARIVLLGFVISLSSTAVVLKLLKDRNELDTPTGQDVLMILLAQDIAIVPMLIMISLMGGQSIELNTVLLQIFGGIAIIAFVIWLVSREQVHLPFAKRLRHDHEMQVFAALLICFGFAFVTSLFQLSVALGAFIGGMVVAAARETDWVQHRLETFRTFFVAIFFVSIGMLIDIGFILSHWIQIGLLVAAVIITNTFINAFVLRALKVSWAQSLYAGALLSQIGEFSFVLASVGYQGQIITEYAYQITAAVIAISLLISTSWIGLMKKFLAFKNLSTTNLEINK